MGKTKEKIVKEKLQVYADNYNEYAVKYNRLTKEMETKNVNINLLTDVLEARNKVKPL